MVYDRLTSQRCRCDDIGRITGGDDEGQASLHQILLLLRGTFGLTFFKQPTSHGSSQRNTKWLLPLRMEKPDSLHCEPSPTEQSRR